MALKVFIVLLLAGIIAAAPKTRHSTADHFFRREIFGGCSKEEIDALVASGVDIGSSTLNCKDHEIANDLGLQKKGCPFSYTATSACCSPGCNWIMEFHCMSPAQMICRKK